jgi:SAM-dependent methyltransferase
MSLLARFFAANRRLVMATEARLPAVFKRHLHTVYKYRVADLVNRRPGQVVVDVGGGKECPFLPFVAEPRLHLIFAIDYSEAELRRNRSLEGRIVADASAGSLPFCDGVADLVVSRSVMEHLPDNAAFLANCARLLRPGGTIVHTFPCKFAPFALLNQLLPNWLTRRLIARLQPQWQDDCGFRAYYDRCYFSAISSLLVRNGFSNPSFVFRYYQSIYFDFFYPLYVVMLLYDLLVAALGIRNLACAVLISAERGFAPQTAPAPAPPPLGRVGHCGAEHVVAAVAATTFAKSAGSRPARTDGSELGG